MTLEPPAPPSCYTTPTGEPNALPILAPVAPRFSIVIPVYKHSELLADAVADAISEISDNSGRLVLVNDGCPFDQTHRACKTFATARPDLIDYIRTPNAGLSAARNRGIRHALARFPSIEAIYMLDADNRLTRGAMRRAIDTLRESGADWVYPNIDKFGLPWSADFSAPHSVLRHLFLNICEAGSLIHRRVFDAGVFFDEAMRQGYEDWEFWLQCINAGFKGAPCTHLEFRYRARRESMLRNSDRSASSIIDYIRKKHVRLFSWPNMLALEHKEAPRFCIVDSSRQEFRLTSTPTCSSRTGTLQEIDSLFWANASYPSHYHFPNFVIAADAAVLQELSHLKIADAVLWHIEELLESNHFVMVTLEGADDRIRFDFTAPETDKKTARDGAHIVAVKRGLLEDCSRDSDTSWTDSLLTSKPAPKVTQIIVRGPFSRRILAIHRNALLATLQLLQILRTSVFHASMAPRWEWRTSESLRPLSQLHQDIRQEMKAMAPLAGAAIRGQSEIGILVPLCSFGGVEQVAIAVARELRREGWATRLIVTQQNEVLAPANAVDAFDAIHFLNDDSYRFWRPSGLVYYGHELQQWPVSGRHDRLYGLLAGCKAVINLHALHANEAMGWLRRQGVITVSSLHLFDHDTFGAPVGHPYITLAYEHAYDLIVAPSRKLLDACGSLGIPDEKLVQLPNAATFQPSERIIARRRTQLSDDAESQCRPLRVLSLGRLDRQKGESRLSALVKLINDRLLPVHWRLVGGKVIDNDSPRSQGIGGQQLIFESPVYERTKVAELMAWADVVVLLSRWEGSPLVILEAQSVGAIPVATDVGGVNEMIENGQTGFIVQGCTDHEISEAAFNVLRTLYEHPRDRLRISANTLNQSVGKTWSQSVRHFFDALNARITK